MPETYMQGNVTRFNMARRGAKKINMATHVRAPSCEALIVLVGGHDKFVPPPRAWLHCEQRMRLVT